MRVSNHAARLAAGAAVVVMFVTACSGPPPSSAPATVPPTPVITPDPHLTEPATADQVFRAIRGGDLPLQVNNASGGDPASPIVKRINAAIGDWPLVIVEFRTSALLRKSTKWDPTKPPVNGNPPYAFVGLNILVEFGPVTGLLAQPDATRQRQADVLASLLNPLLSPIERRSVSPSPTSTAGPVSSVASTVVSPSPAP